MKALKILDYQHTHHHQFKEIKHSHHRQPRKSRVKIQRTPTCQKTEPLRVLTINFQSIKNTKPEVELIIESCKPSIIFGTETWLSNDISPYMNTSHPLNTTFIRKIERMAMGEYYWLSQTS